MNQHLVKNKKKEILHSYFLVRYASHIYGSDDMEYTFKIISSLPTPFSMIFFEKNHENSYPHYQKAFQRFTEFIKYTSKFDLNPYTLPLHWDDELKRSPEFLDNLKSVWLGQLPPVNVASPSINPVFFWSISCDIMCLKEMLPDLYRVETNKLSKQEFEKNLNSAFQKNEYVEHFKKFNNNFHVSEEEKYIISWGEYNDGELSKPLLVTCREI